MASRIIYFAYALLMYNMWVCANVELTQSRWNGKLVIVDHVFGNLDDDHVQDQAGARTTSVINGAHLRGLWIRSIGTTSTSINWSCILNSRAGL